MLENVGLGSQVVIQNSATVSRTWDMITITKVIRETPKRLVAQSFSFVKDTGACVGFPSLSLRACTEEDLKHNKACLQRAKVMDLLNKSSSKELFNELFTKLQEAEDARLDGILLTSQSKEIENLSYHNTVFHGKLQWVRKQQQVKHLGMHLADVAKDLVDQRNEAIKDAKHIMQALVAQVEAAEIGLDLAYKLLGKPQPVWPNNVGQAKDWIKSN